MEDIKPTVKITDYYEEILEINSRLAKQNNVSDAELEKAAGRIYELEDLVSAWPTQNLFEFAVKISVCDVDGDMSLTKNHVIVAQEAHAIVARGI